MGRLKINQEKINDESAEKLIKICPFNAIEYKNGILDINAACKMCKICIKKGPEGAIEFVEDDIREVDKNAWKGIVVYVVHVEGKIHPVTFELIGKAKELAKKVNYPVYCI